MTRLVALAVAAAVAAGCAVAGDDPEASRVDRCVERLLSRADAEDLTPERRPVAERYVRETYCHRFERERWINADGTLSIDAHRWVAGGMRCAVAEDGESSGEVDCEALARREHDPLVECALLHHVPKAEVETYLRGLGRARGVELECDDGTPLDELGAG